MNGYIYLASPYSHPDPKVREQRFEAACAAAAKLMLAGATIFCPIAHSHPISLWMRDAEQSHGMWMQQDLPLLARATGLAVLMLDGWLDSKGVQEEITFAFDHNIPVKYVQP